MFKRAMHKTRKVLIDKMQAIEFPYLNKVQECSRRNAYAMFFGEQSIKIGASILNNYTETKWTDQQKICETPMDNFNFIGYDFWNQSFKTMMTEDWASGVIGKNCWDFLKNLCV